LTAKVSNLSEDDIADDLTDCIAFKICDKNMRTYINVSGTKGASNSRGRPEIDRTQLRKLLVDSLPKEIIRWGHHLKSVEDKDGVFSLHFNTGIESGFDLIVGADGAWSHVRSVLTDVKPEYSGVSGVSFTISDPETRCPDLYKFVNRGSMFAFGESKSIMAQQLGTGSLSVSAWSAAHEDNTKQFISKLDNPSFIKAVLKQERESWSPELLKFIDMSDGPQEVRNLYQLPIGTRWKNRHGITLLGDAAHLMTPFAGEGVNLAMTDAMRLSAAIRKAVKLGTLPALTEEVKAFEEDMFVRATQFQKQTYTMMSLMYLTPGAPDATIEKWIVAAATDSLPFLLVPLFTGVVYTYFWFWRLFN
jgi:2-polyprenyl-6-methoxyphenol hydroxylase-like FAD-dependent oxidoreductase